MYAGDAASKTGLAGYTTAEEVPGAHRTRGNKTHDTLFPSLCSDASREALLLGSKYFKIAGVISPFPGCTEFTEKLSKTWRAFEFSGPNSPSGVMKSHSLHSGQILLDFTLRSYFRLGVTFIMKHSPQKSGKGFDTKVSLFLIKIVTTLKTEHTAGDTQLPCV